MAKRDLTVVDSVLAELKALKTRDEALSCSPLAATALALAREMDAPGNSATSKAACARSLQDILTELRGLAPPVVLDDHVDEIQARAAKKLRAVK